MQIFFSWSKIQFKITLHLVVLSGTVPWPFFVCLSTESFEEYKQLFWRTCTPGTEIVCKWSFSEHHIKKHMIMVYPILGDVNFDYLFKVMPS